MTVWNEFMNFRWEESATTSRWQIFKVLEIHLHITPHVLGVMDVP